MRERLLQFIGNLRAAGVRISLAETLDAMNAVATAGFERIRMREALAAALIKDEGDRPLFDATFGAFFSSAGARRSSRQDRTGEQLSAAGGRGRTAGDTAPPSEREDESREVGERPGEEPAPSSALGAARDRREDRNARSRTGGDDHGGAADSPGTDAPHGDDDRGLAASAAEQRRAERRPFAQYSDLDYERARDALQPLVRRFRIRLGRRMRLARAGRLDFRRTIRAATQRGGTLIDLRFRARRPRHIRLLILADVSGSVRYAANLMLELVAGARQCFRRVDSLVFIDRLADAEFEQGHLVMTPALDPYARSDFGRVLAELVNRKAELLSRATVLVILGDARNNRRPARADLLREIVRQVRAVIWLNPELPERWGSGDSAINQYAREVTALLPCSNLMELERDLLRVA